MCILLFCFVALLLVIVLVALFGFITAVSWVILENLIF